MKRYKFVIYVLVLVMLFDLLRFDFVNADNSGGTNNNWVYDMTGLYLEQDLSSGMLSFIASNNGNKVEAYSTNYNGIGLSSGVSVSIKSFNVNDVDYTSKVYSNNIAIALDKTNYNNLGLIVLTIRGVNFSIKDTDRIKLNFTYSVNLSSIGVNKTCDGTISVSGVVKSGWVLVSSFKLIYNNDYNYTSNNASFTMQYSNFSFNYFTFLNTDLLQNGVFGGFHLLNYTIDNNVVKCSFDNTYETMSNPHYLCYTAHGLDIMGNPIDVSGSISFNINVDTAPKVQSYKVSYVMDGSPCISGSGGGRLYLYIDYGSGYVLQDTSKWSLTLSQIPNGGQDTFSYGVDTNFNTAYKISITKVDDIDEYDYDIYVNDKGINLTGKLKVCSNDDYVFDASGSQTSGQETDIFTILQDIKNIFVSLWYLVLSIVNFFGALFISIFSIAYSMGVAFISLLKILIDFVASVSSVLFNRNTNYYSLSNIMSLPNSFTYQGQVIGLFGLWGQIDTWLKFIHDNVVIQYSGVWAVISLIYLIKKHIIIETVEDEDE